MKKFLFAVALIAMACGAFATGAADPSATMTGWTDWGWSGGYLSDLADGRGFTVDLTSAPVGTAIDNIRGVTFLTFGPSGWVYDSNESFAIEIDENFADADGSYSVSLIASAGNNGAWYDKIYNGPGTYVFTAADLLSASDYVNNSEITQIWFTFGSGKSMTSGDYITVRFKTSEDEEETVVPEPASAAYALLGLGSLMGIKRRIKK